MAKRTKYVYTDNSSIAHLWIGHNLSGKGQEQARNPSQNFYFSGDTIYSYGSHFPMARFVRSGKKQAIQFTTRSYSVTTSGHLSTVRGAIQGNDIPVFYVRNAADEARYPENLADYSKRIEEAIANQIKARSTRNMESFRGEALALIAECKEYCKFWKVKSPKFPKVPALPANFKEKRKREKELQDARDEKSRVEREARAAEYVKQNAERVARDTAAILEWNANYEYHVGEWIGGGELGLPRISNYYSYANELPKLREVPTLLRIKGTEVETSRFASFPIAHAIRGLKLVDAVIARGEDWIANGHTCKLGLYSISKILVTTEGAQLGGGALIFAGCHIVPYTSVLRIREQLLALADSSENSTEEGN